MAFDVRNVRYPNDLQLFNLEFLIQSVVSKYCRLAAVKSGPTLVANLCDMLAKLTTRFSHLGYFKLCI